jgi:hypothetical protein
MKEMSGHELIANSVSDPRVYAFMMDLNMLMSKHINVLGVENVKAAFGLVATAGFAIGRHIDTNVPLSGAAAEVLADALDRTLRFSIEDNYAKNMEENRRG